MLRRNLVAGEVFSALFAVEAQADTFRISCQDFDGTRVQFAAHPNSPPNQRNRLVKAEDAITGVKVEITFSTADKTAKATMYGNVNTGGRVASMDLIQLTSAGTLSFIGIDSEDGSVNVFSYFADLKRLIWTVHSDRIFVIDQIALGKTFMAPCTAQKL